jgi:hypothetical protein
MQSSDWSYNSCQPARNKMLLGRRPHLSSAFMPEIKMLHKHVISPEKSRLLNNGIFVLKIAQANTHEPIALL